MNGLSAIFLCAGRAVALIIKVKQRAAFEDLPLSFSKYVENVNVSIVAVDPGNSIISPVCLFTTLSLVI